MALKLFHVGRRAVGRAWVYLTVKSCLQKCKSAVGYHVEDFIFVTNSENVRPERQVRNLITKIQFKVVQSVADSSCRLRDLFVKTLKCCNTYLFNIINRYCLYGKNLKLNHEVCIHKSALNHTTVPWYKWNFC